MRKLEDCCSSHSEALLVLQCCATCEPFFPNLEFVRMWYFTRESIPFIHSFLSLKTTAIDISFNSPDACEAVAASMIATFPTLCPGLRSIPLKSLPRNPLIITTVSGILLVNNRDNFQRFHVDSPLTKEACKVISKLPNLRELSAVVERDVSWPPVAPQNLTSLEIKYDGDHGWLEGFRGAISGSWPQFDLVRNLSRLVTSLRHSETSRLPPHGRSQISGFTPRAHGKQIIAPPIRAAQGTHNPVLLHKWLLIDRR